MNNEELEKMMKGIPGAKKAKQGFIIEGNGVTLHLQGVLLQKDTEGLTNDETFFLAFCSKKEIQRLREIKTAHDYLLKLRADAIVDAPRSVRVMRQRRTIYEGKGNQWHLAHYYHTLGYYHKGYIKKLSKRHKKIVKQVPAGLALKREINAEYRKSLVGDLVIVSENMIHFCYFMTIGCYGHCYGINKNDCLWAFAIAMRIMLENESLDFDLDPRCILDERTELKIRNIVKLQMQFIFGHEYAHILLNHLNDDSTNANYSHSQEYDADYNAISNIASSEKDKKEILLAALDLFIFLDIYSQFSMLVSNKQTHENDTHPQPIERFHNLLNRFNKLLGSDKDKILLQLTNTRNYAENIHQRFKQMTKQMNKDAITFYGSIYLPSYKPKKIVDRIDY